MSDPDFIAQSTGGRRFTLAALREQVEAQFEEETAGRLDIFQEANTEAARREIVVECANYVLSNEAIFLSRAEKRRLIDAVCAHLFHLGPLAPHLRDETVTEVTINGPGDINIRLGFGPLAPLPVRFDDPAHLRRAVNRLLMLHGTQLADWEYFFEVGVSLQGRPARLSIITPPVTPQMQVEIRLHPAAPLTLDDLVACAVLDAVHAHTLTAHLEARRGLLIVGQAGTGKTTLLGALLGALPGHAVLMQRAAEIHPAAHIEAQDITETLPGGALPGWLALDEVRDDIASVAWEALNLPGGTANLWVFRGAPTPARITSALGMLLRRVPEVMAMDQADIGQRLAERLPLVVRLGLGEDGPRVLSLDALVLKEGRLVLDSTDFL